MKSLPIHEAVLTSTPAPSPITNPPRDLSNGRQHPATGSNSYPKLPRSAAGILLSINFFITAGSASARAREKPTSETASMHDSVPLGKVPGIE